MKLKNMTLRHVKLKRDMFMDSRFYIEHNEKKMWFQTKLVPKNYEDTNLGGFACLSLGSPLFT